MNENNNIATIYAIKDELTGRFMQPFFLKGKTHKEEAERLFKSQGSNITLWKDNANDYSLYQIGNFDEETGYLFTTENNAILINHLSAYIH